MNQLRLTMDDIRQNDEHTISFHRISSGNSKKESKLNTLCLRGNEIHLVLFSPFPTVAESIQEELERYRQLEDEVKRLKTQFVR